MELLGVLVVIGVALFALLTTLAVVAAILKFVFWVVFLPIRLVFYVVLFPILLLVKLVIGGVLLLALGPVLIVGAIVGVFAFALALILPLLPFIALAALIWFLVKSSRQPLPAGR